MTFVMKTFLILAVSARSAGSGESGYGSGSGSGTESGSGIDVSVKHHENFLRPSSDMGSDLKNVAYSCAGNNCRSAAAQIFTQALIAADIPEFCKVNCYSFANNLNSPKDLPATEFLLKALQTGKDKFVSEIETKLDRVLTEDQKKSLRKTYAMRAKNSWCLI